MVNNEHLDEFKEYCRETVLYGECSDKTCDDCFVSFLEERTESNVVALEIKDGVDFKVGDGVVVDRGIFRVKCNIVEIDDNFEYPYHVVGFETNGWVKKEKISKIFYK